MYDTNLAFFETWMFYKAFFLYCYLFFPGKHHHAHPRGHNLFIFSSMSGASFNFKQAWLLSKEYTKIAHRLLCHKGEGLSHYIHLSCAHTLIPIFYLFRFSNDYYKMLTCGGIFLCMTTVLLFAYLRDYTLMVLTVVPQAFGFSLTVLGSKLFYA